MAAGHDFFFPLWPQGSWYKPTAKLNKDSHLKTKIAAKDIKQKF